MHHLRYQGREEGRGVEEAAAGADGDGLPAGVDEVGALGTGRGSSPVPSMPFSLGSMTRTLGGTQPATGVGMPMPKLTYRGSAFCRAKVVASFSYREW